MGWFHENSFIDHSKGRGGFHNTITNEPNRFSDKDRLLALTILNLWPTDPAEQDPYYSPPNGFLFARSTFEEMVGSCSNDFWKYGIENLVSCGVFKIERSLGGRHSLSLGDLIKCSEVGCCETKRLHLPHWADPSVYRRSNYAEQRPPLQTAETSPPIVGDIKNLNNSKESLINVSEVLQVEVRIEKESLAAEESKQLSLEEYQREIQELAPPGVEIHENLIQFGYLRELRGTPDKERIIEWASESKTLKPEGQKWRAGIGNVYGELIEIGRL
jgi:hypothetical protein